MHAVEIKFPCLIHFSRENRVVMDAGKSHSLLQDLSYNNINQTDLRLILLFAIRE